MDLTIYYAKIREQAAAIADEFPVVVSTESEDGGRAGVHTEVPRAVAARMMADGRVRMATVEEAAAFREAHAAAKAVIDKQAAAEKVKVAYVERLASEIEKG